MPETNYIAGKWQAGQGSTFASRDPGTGEVIWQGQFANVKQAEQGVDAAEKAFPAWAELTVNERARILENFCQVLEANKLEFADLISQETGKPFWESQTEVTAMMNKLGISREALAQRAGVSREEVQGGYSMLRHRPHGVIGIIGPFNFPGHLPNGHIIPALLAGNTIVFKPSELVPKTSIRVLQLWQEAGLPEGVINLIHGGAEIGKCLIDDPRVRGIFFTGSYATGCLIHQRLAGHPEKLLVMEMGGNNPLLVYHVQDLKSAAYQIVLSAYITAGQRCTCARRLIIQDNEEGDKLLETLLEQIELIQVGHYCSQPEPFMGPVISATTAMNLLEKQQQLCDQGAHLLKEMRLLKENTGLLSPGLVEMTGVEKPIDEEIFGPLLQVFRVSTLKQGIKEANRTRYGLSAGIFTDEVMAYDLFLKQVNAGLINWNKQLTGASSGAPFGGIGRSGNFRPSAFYAADYCAYPVASIENSYLPITEQPMPGLPKLRASAE